MNQRVLSKKSVYEARAKYIELRGADDSGVRCAHAVVGRRGLIGAVGAATASDRNGAGEGIAGKAAEIHNVIRQAQVIARANGVINPQVTGCRRQNGSVVTPGSY
jgi:hypothetical protein